MTIFYSIPYCIVWLCFCLSLKHLESEGEYEDNFDLIDENDFDPSFNRGGFNLGYNRPRRYFPKISYRPRNVYRRISYRPTRVSRKQYRPRINYLPKRRQYRPRSYPKISVIRVAKQYRPRKFLRKISVRRSYGARKQYRPLRY